MPEVDRPDLDVESLLRELRPEDMEFPTPPDSAWKAIEARLGTAPLPRRRATPLLLVAAAVASIVTAAAALVATNRPDPSLVAVADLAYDAESFDPIGATSTASARLVSRDGTLEIVIDEARLPEPGNDADLELWMIATDDDGTIVDIAPIARLDGPGSYTVPSGLDATSHRIIDISVEPRDGNASHSGRSILRGTLVDA